MYTVRSFSNIPVLVERVNWPTGYGVMPESSLRLVRRVAEFKPREELPLLPHKLRGIYVLYKKRKVRGRDHYDVLYVGMAAAGGIRGRLTKHSKSKRKGGLWTHFSAYAVWDNIRAEEVAELEGLFRHIYRKDAKANALNIQRGFKKLKHVKENDLKKWQ